MAKWLENNFTKNTSWVSGWGMSGNGGWQNKHWILHKPCDPNPPPAHSYPDFQLCVRYSKQPLVQLTYLLRDYGTSVDIENSSGRVLESRPATGSYPRRMLGHWLPLPYVHHIAPPNAATQTTTAIRTTATAVGLTLFGSLSSASCSSLTLSSSTSLLSSSFCKWIVQYTCDLWL